MLQNQMKRGFFYKLRAAGVTPKTLMKAQRWGHSPIHLLKPTESIVVVGTGVAVFVWSGGAGFGGETGDAFAGAGWGCWLYPGSPCGVVIFVN